MNRWVKKSLMIATATTGVAVQIVWLVALALPLAYAVGRLADRLTATKPVSANSPASATSSNIGPDRVGDPGQAIGGETLGKSPLDAAD